MKLSSQQLRLYAVSDSSYLRGRTLAQAVREAIEGGATIVQYREKKKGPEEMLAEASSLRAVCRDCGIPFIVNDSVELAQAVDADGVHLGLEDGSLERARQILGAGKIIGASAHNPREARAAQAQGADYLGCGAVFGSATKTNVQAISPEILREVTQAVTIPVVAIGGITKENIHLLRGCGLSGVAVVSALFAQPDIPAATRELLTLAEEIVK